MLREPGGDEMITPRGRMQFISEVVLPPPNPDSRVDFAGLDVIGGRMYYLEADFRNAIAANTRYHVYVNGNEADARYQRQRIYGAGAGVTAQRVNEARALEVTANQRAKMCLTFHLSFEDYPYIEGMTLGRHGANIHMQMIYIQCLDTYPIITSITLMSRDVALAEVNGFLVASRFRLYSIMG